MKSACIQTGTTTDGKPVMSGIYRFYETYGLPLDIIFDVFVKKDWVPSWIDLYKDCQLAGMSYNRILSKIGEAISDSLFGKEYSDIVISKLDTIFKNKENE